MNPKSANASKGMKHRQTGKSTRDPKNSSKDSKELFLKKVAICSVVYDYSDETKDIKAKADKNKAIGELQDLVIDPKNVSTLIIPNLSAVMEMVEKNLFRALPNTNRNQGIPNEAGVDEEEMLVDPAFPYLQGIYQFFFQLISSDAADVKSLKVFVTPTFVQELLSLFDSQEPRERDFLKNILHRLYARLVPRRKMIRKAINETFYTIIHETGQFNGVAELLDILASIISGFAVPLRDEHVVFFKNIIIPLHKVPCSHSFHDLLMRCSMLFLSKDHNLATPLVQGLLRYWPFGNSLKETLFLTELQEVLEVCDLAKLEGMIKKLFRRLVKCISGPHLQVADRAMCFFENDYFLNILKSYKHITFPMLVPVIVDLAETHWHKILQDSLNALKTILKEIDPVSFDKALQNRDDYPKLHQDPNSRKALDKKWEALNSELKKTNSSYKEPEVLYRDDQLIGNINVLYAE